MTLKIAIQLSIILIFSIACSIQDIKRRKVNNFLCTAAIFSQLVFNLIFATDNFFMFLITAVIATCLYFTVRQISHKKLGIADVFFSAFQGLCLTPYPFLFCTLISIASALIAGFTVFKKQKIPFIPFMATGLFASYLLWSI